MKVAIVGSRDFPQWYKVWEFVTYLPPDTVVVSGGARGVDTSAVEAATACGLKVEVYRADWKRYGLSAGFKRNQQIVDAADRVVAFWDGVSRGTADTLDKAALARKPIRIIRSD